MIIETDRSPFKIYKYICFSSPVSNQSLLSESVASSQVDSTSVDKAIPETEDLQGLQMN